MHLARTGAFLRALRSARLAAPKPSTVSPVYAERWISSTSRCRSSPSAFPEQSVSSSEEVDPRKTTAESTSPGQDGGSTGTQQSTGTLPRRVRAAPADESAPGKKILGEHYPSDKTTNITDSILSLVGRNLYTDPNHPIAITRRLIESVFPQPTYTHHVETNPIVTVHDNFDILGFPADHPGRSRTDTYYIDSSTVLRTHTSAHQHAAFEHLKTSSSTTGYTICADVYRRDSIDRSHFPVFHQMEGARTWALPEPQTKNEGRLQRQKRRAIQIRSDIDDLPKHNLEILDEAGPYNNHTNPIQVQHDPKDSQLVVEHLKRSLEQLVQRVFTAAQHAHPDKTKHHDQLKVRWIEAYFPFTSPSFELEVLYNGQWLELLGSGVVQQSILNKAGLNDRIAWAWGIGIERLAMLLFNVPDIRLFWSQDDRFLRQFREGEIRRFEGYSKFPPCYKDVSFWVPASPAGASPMAGADKFVVGGGVAAAAGGDATKASPSEVQPAAFHENDIMEIVRDVAGTLVEDVSLVDEFVHPRSGKKSLCYRVNYRSHERTLTNEEVNGLHERVVGGVRGLGVEIR